MNKPPGPPYTPIVRSGDWLICSGQVGQVDGKIVEGGLEPELRQTFRNLRAVLESEGASLENVVKTTVYLTNSDEWPAMNEIYAEEFGDHWPARAAVTVAGLPLGACVELEAWARV